MKMIYALSTLLLLISCKTILAEMRITETRTELIVDGVKLPAAIMKPEDGKIKAAVVIVPGSLFNDVDGNYPDMPGFNPHFYLDLSKQLAQRGYAVLRYAKHGPQTGSVVVDEMESRRHREFAERMVVAKEAIHTLKDSVGDSLPMIIAGHSEGVLVASLVAQDENAKIDAVISLSGPADRFFDLMIRQASGRPIGNADNLREYGDMFALVRAGGSIPKEKFATNPYLQSWSLVPDNAWPYLREMDTLDPRVEISKVKQPVLLVLGSLDESVYPESAKLLKESRSTKATSLALIDGLDHFYKRSKPGMSMVEMIELMATESSTAVTDEIDQWFMKLRAKDEL